MHFADEASGSLTWRDLAFISSLSVQALANAGSLLSQGGKQFKKVEDLPTLKEKIKNMGLLNIAIPLIRGKETSVPNEDNPVTSSTSFAKSDVHDTYKKAIETQMQKDYLLLTNFSFLLWAIFDAIQLSVAADPATISASAEGWIWFIESIALLNFQFQDFIQVQRLTFGNLKIRELIFGNGHLIHRPYSKHTLTQLTKLSALIGFTCQAVSALPPLNKTVKDIIHVIGILFDFLGLALDFQLANPGNLYPRKSTGASVTLFLKNFFKSEKIGHKMDNLNAYRKQADHTILNDNHYLDVLTGTKTVSDETGSKHVILNLGRVINMLENLIAFLIILGIPLDVVDGWLIVLFRSAPAIIALQINRK